MIVNGSVLLALAAAASTVRGAIIPECVWKCHQDPALRQNTGCDDLWDDVCVFDSLGFGPRFHDCISRKCPPDFVRRNPDFAARLMEAFDRLNQAAPLNRRVSRATPSIAGVPAAPACAVYSLTNLAATAGASCPLNQAFGACVCQVHDAEKEVLEFCAGHMERGRLKEVLKWIRSICSDYVIAGEKGELPGDTVEEIAIGDPKDLSEKQTDRIIEAVKKSAAKEAKNEAIKNRVKAKQASKQLKKLQKTKEAAAKAGKKKEKEKEKLVKVKESATKAENKNEEEKEKLEKVKEATEDKIEKIKEDKEDKEEKEEKAKEAKKLLEEDD